MGGLDRSIRTDHPHRNPEVCPLRGPSGIYAIANHRHDAVARNKRLYFFDLFLKMSVNPLPLSTCTSVVGAGAMHLASAERTIARASG